MTAALLLFAQDVPAAPDWMQNVSVGVAFIAVVWYAYYVTCRALPAKDKQVLNAINDFREEAAAQRAHNAEQVDKMAATSKANAEKTTAVMHRMLTQCAADRDTT